MEDSRVAHGDGNCGRTDIKDNALTDYIGPAKRRYFKQYYHELTKSEFPQACAL